MNWMIQMSKFSLLKIVGKTACSQRKRKSKKEANVLIFVQLLRTLLTDGHCDWNDLRFFSKSTFKYDTKYVQVKMGFSLKEEKAANKKEFLFSRNLNMNCFVPFIIRFLF